MADNRRHIRVAAFSVLEVTIVIGLLGLVSALVFGALNRFSEQVRNETQIRNELNAWFVVRAALWRELDGADSIAVTKDRAAIWFMGKPTDYYIAGNRLFRKKGETDADLNIAMNAILSEEVKGRRYVTFNIDWKGEEMLLRYPLRTTVADRINRYFTERAWQQ